MNIPPGGPLLLNEGTLSYARAYLREYLLNLSQDAIYLDFLDKATNAAIQMQDPSRPGSRDLYILLETMVAISKITLRIRDAMDMIALLTGGYSDEQCKDLLTLLESLLLKLGRPSAMSGYRAKDIQTGQMVWINPPEVEDLFALWRSNVSLPELAAEVPGPRKHRKPLRRWLASWKFSLRKRH